MPLASPRSWRSAGAALILVGCACVAIHRSTAVQDISGRQQPALVTPFQSLFNENFVRAAVDAAAGSLSAPTSPQASPAPSLYFQMGAGHNGNFTMTQNSPMENHSVSYDVHKHSEHVEYKGTKGFADGHKEHVHVETEWRVEYPDSGPPVDKIAENAPPVVGKLYLTLSGSVEDFDQEKTSELRLRLSKLTGARPSTIFLHFSPGSVICEVTMQPWAVLALKNRITFGDTQELAGFKVLRVSSSKPDGPSEVPTLVPTSEYPTLNPSHTPTLMQPLSKPPVQTDFPTLRPSTGHPTLIPTLVPSETPTVTPTTGTPVSLAPLVATLVPTFAPTAFPTLTPTLVPSVRTSAPTPIPTKAPTLVPSFLPTTTPSFLPTSHDPTLLPTKWPTLHPSTILPSFVPTRTPTLPPTPVPTMTPTYMPVTDIPSVAPTVDVVAHEKLKKQIKELRNYVAHLRTRLSHPPSAEPESAPSKEPIAEPEEEMSAASSSTSSSTSSSLSEEKKADESGMPEEPNEKQAEPSSGPVSASASSGLWKG